MARFPWACPWEYVKKIQDEEFMDCVNLVSVILPESLKEIGEGAFLGCEKLQKINLPSGLTYIAPCAFFECVSLPDPEIPEGIKTIERETFVECEFKGIKLPKTLEKIGESAFWLCNKLESIEIPGNVTEIDNHAFDSCEELKSITLPEGLKSISFGAFLPPRTHAILRVSAEMHMNWDMTPAKVRKTILDTMTDCGVPENERQKVFERALNTLANVMNADSMATKGNPKMRNDAFTILADARKISKDELVVKGKELADMAGTDVRRSSLVSQMVLDAINKGLPNTKESLKTYLETEETRKDLKKRIQEYDSKLKTR